MPSFSKGCDMYQGFNFKKDKTTTVGFITKLKVATSDITADFTVKDVLNPTTDLKVAAVLTSVLWETGVTDAVYLSGQISATNRQNVALLTYLNLTNVEVTFQFTVYEYDPVQKKYYKCLHCNDADMKGILEKSSGGDLNITVADEPGSEVQSPINYSFQIGIKPQPTAQTLQIATADQKTVVKSWGVTQT